MGCGSSRTQTTMIREMYREPSEFDTCSTVVSGRENRGEPDGKEAIAPVGDPPSNSENQLANRKQVSKTPYTSRNEVSARTKINDRPEAHKNGPRVIFTALTEHNDHDVSDGGRHQTKRCMTAVKGGGTEVQVVPVMKGVPEEEGDLLVAT